MAHTTNVSSEEQLAYAKLLEEHLIERYEAARGVLEPPLAHLLFAFYRLRSEGPIEVDILSHESASFVFDSAGAFLGEGRNRVVGVIATSRATLPLGSLLDRLQEEGTRGLSTGETVEEVHFTINTYLNAASRSRRRELGRALANALRLTELPIPEILDRIIESCRAGGRAEVSRLRTVARILRRTCHEIGSSHPVFRITVGEQVTDAVVKPLLTMAAATFPPSLRPALAQELSGYSLETNAFYTKLAEATTGDLIERARHHLVPLVDYQSARPRDALAQRKARLGRGTGVAYDIGHFIPHAAGGPTRVNFFLQEPRLNRGWSVQGKQYSWLERYVTSHPGSFYFVRPIYEDASEVPRYLEWGVLLEGSEAERLAGELESKPDLFLLRPEKCPPALNVLWLLGRFSNFPEGQPPNGAWWSSGSSRREA
jgi:hypothetical protein